MGLEPYIRFTWFYFSMFSFFLVVHTIADYFLQPRSIATKKDKSFVALLHHILIYSGVMFLGGIAAITLLWLYLGMLGSIAVTWFPWVFTVAALFAGVNGLTHLCIDFVTSKLTGKFYRSRRFHAFFNVLGVDQLLHILVLGATTILFISYM